MREHGGTTFVDTWCDLMVPRADMSNVIEGAIDIDFFEVLTIDIELTIFESLTLPLTLRLVNDCLQLLTLALEDFLTLADIQTMLCERCAVKYSENDEPNSNVPQCKGTKD